MASMGMRSTAPPVVQSQHRSIVCNSMGGRGRGAPGGRNVPDFANSDNLLLGRSGQQNMNRPPPKLVLPGKGPGSGPGGRGAGGRLIIPEDGIEAMLAQGAEKLGPEVTTPTAPNRYRPPAGFMNEDGPAQNEEIARMSPEEMLQRLRARAGRWHTLARFLPVLYQSGYDSGAVDEATGITPALQNRWIVAGTVYDSLVASGRLDEGVLARFDGRGDDLLHPFRFLNQEMRVEAALYLLEKNFDGPMCEVLARAMKEWERRPLERQGFAPSPADCLSFKYMRDALECRKLEQAEAKFQQAMDAAATDGARARVTEAWESARAEDAARRGVAPAPSTSDNDGAINPLASLMILRLDPEELGFRPIPVMGALGTASASDVASAPRTTQEGAFGTFNISCQAASCAWVALPQWKALAMMRHPIALSVVDCAAVPNIVAGTKCKTDDDRRRLTGVGLVVADAWEEGSQAELDGAAFYLAHTKTDATLQLVDGARARAKGMTVVASVAFVARPPTRETQVGTSESLIQL